MQELKIEGFEVVGNTDDIEGRGAPTHIAYTTKMSVAQDIAVGRGPMGSPASVVKVSKTIKVFETFEEFENEQKENFKERALAKLTDVEKRALGLIK